MESGVSHILENSCSESSTFQVFYNLSDRSLNATQKFKPQAAALFFVADESKFKIVFRASGIAQFHLYLLRNSFMHRFPVMKIKLFLMIFSVSLSSYLFWHSGMGSSALFAVIESHISSTSNNFSDSSSWSISALIAFGFM